MKLFKMQYLYKSAFCLFDGVFLYQRVTEASSEEWEQKLQKQFSSLQAAAKQFIRVQNPI